MDIILYTAPDGIVKNVVLSYSDDIKNYDNFMKAHPHTFRDKIIVGKFEIRSTFKYHMGVTYFKGPTQVYKNNVLIYDGNLHCNVKICEFTGW